MRYYLTPIRMVTILKTNKQTNKTQKITIVDEDMEKLKLLCTVVGIVKWSNHDGKWYGDFSKN